MNIFLSRAVQFTSHLNRTFLLPAKKITQLLLLSLLTGLLAGLVGTLFQFSVEYVFELHNRVTDDFQHEPVLSWLIPVASTAIMLLVALYLVRRLSPEAGGSGVQEIEGALEGTRPIHWQRLIPVKFFAGICTIGGGMVMGREGPTIHMGGNIGYMISRLFKSGRDYENTLVTAGAAAGLSAAFNAPLSAILFAVEEMRTQFKYGTYSVQAVALAVFIAAVVVRYYMGQVPAIDMRHFPPPPLPSLPLFLFLGVVFGLFGIIFNRSLINSLNLFSAGNGAFQILLVVSAGSLIGYLSWQWPEAIGSGDQTLIWAMQHKGAIGVLITLFFVRTVTTLISYGTGAPGGIFAPMLALGTLFGLWYGHYMDLYFPALALEPGVFAVAGMGALFAATVRAPLTGIALSIELTNNYSLILPMILTVGTATVTAELLGGKPVYSLLLQRVQSNAGKRNQGNQS